MNKSLKSWLSLILSAALMLSFAYGEEAVSPWDAYAPVMQNAFSALNNPDTWEDIPGVMGVKEVAMAMGEDAGNNVGATLMDINGDGSPELLLGEIFEPDAPSPSGTFIFSCFTLADGVPQLVYEGWYRNRYDYLGNGAFFHRGSNGAAQYAFGTFHLNPGETQLTCDEFFFSDWADENFTELGYFTNTTGEWDVAVSTRMDMTSEEFSNMEAQRVELLQSVEMIPLSQLSVPSAQSAPITAVLVDEWNPSFEQIVISSDDARANLLLTASDTIYNFTVLELSLKNAKDNGELSFDATPVGESIAQLSPDSPLMVGLTFPGDLPSYGIQFTQQDGSLCRYALTLSGEDGSVLLLETHPTNTDFVLPAGE